MPRRPNNYSSTYFYKLCCRDTTIPDIYVGHTTDFTKRKSQHKTTCCNPNDKDHMMNCYQFIRGNGGWENWDMVLIETQSCANKLEVKKMERGFIEQLNATLNTSLPVRSREEYYHGKVDMIRSAGLRYREQNRQALRDKSKAYGATHKEERKAYHKSYTEQNKDKIKQHMLEQMECEVCGHIFTRCHRLRHTRTQRHQQALLRQTADTTQEI